MATHDLDDESARVRRGGGRNAVDSLADAVKGSGGAWNGDAYKYLRRLCGVVVLGDLPMVMSVPAMSLSILPTRPTMLRCLWASYCS